MVPAVVPVVRSSMSSGDEEIAVTSWQRRGRRGGAGAMVKMLAALPVASSAFLWIGSRLGQWGCYCSSEPRV